MLEDQLNKLSMRVSIFPEIVSRSNLLILDEPAYLNLILEESANLAIELEDVMYKSWSNVSASKLSILVSMFPENVSIQARL